MASIQFKLANTSAFSNNFAAILLGKNGFQSNFGSIPLLANSVSIVDQIPDVQPNGNIKIGVVGFNQLHDYNFDKHVLKVNDIAFKANNVVKGDDYVTLPIEDKTTDLAQENFVGFLPSITELSYNIAGFNIEFNHITVVNDHAGTQTLSARLQEPPFYVTIQQLIDKDYGLAAKTATIDGWQPNTLGAGNVYVKGSTRTLILENDTSTYTGVTTLPLGVDVKDKKFIKFYVDGIPIDPSNFAFTPDTNTITFDFTGDVGAQQRARTEATYYTVPAIERGDNITLFTGNTYAVTNVSYDSSNVFGDYNARITANTIYRITLGTPLSANVGGATILNITNDPNGFIGNVLQTANTLTFDYSETTYPGNWNLANNQIYQLGSRLEYEQYFFGQISRKIIPNVPFGLNSVRARNKNSAGLLSPYTTQSLFIRQIPIQKVENLEITESLYLDTNRGIATRATISFDAIEGQSVTDYEVSYKVSGTQIIGGVEQMTPLTSFNTVKVNNAGVDADGKIRVTIQNVDRLTKGQVTLFARVTPLNKELRGIVAEINQVILGKTSPPSNVSTFIVGQNENNLVFNWSFPVKIDGTLVDLDLEHVEIRRAAEGVNTNDQSAIVAAFGRSPQLAIVSAPSTSVTTPVPNYETNTYIIATLDTSGNRSETFIAYQFQASRPPDLQVFAAFSEGDPDTPFATNSIGEPIVNYNAGEANYPSLASTLKDGLVYADKLLREGVTTAQTPSTLTDNANGAASGWSTTGDADDIIASESSAEYVTQIRDLGSNVTGKVIVSVSSSVTTVDKWTGAREGAALLSAASDVNAGRPGITGANVLIDKGAAIGPSGTIGVGEFLFNNVISSAETIAFDKFVTKTLTSNSTDTTGSVSTLPAARTFTGNVYAIWNPGQFAGDTSNANSFALIANVINAVAIELGNAYVVSDMAQRRFTPTFVTTSSGTGATLIVNRQETSYSASASAPGSGYSVSDELIIYGQQLGGANLTNNATVTVGAVDGSGGITGVSVAGTARKPTASRYRLTPNSMPNVTQNTATYTIVNLSQWLDVPGKTFQGDPSAIKQNLDFRISSSNVWLAANNAAFVTPNGNVKTNSFINFNIASGFTTAQSTDQKFRWFQCRLKVENANPTQNDFLLDSFNYTIDLKDKIFRKVQPIITTNVAFDYSDKDFRTTPSVSATVSNTDVAIIAVVANIGLSVAHVNCYFSANGVAVNGTNYPKPSVPRVTLDVIGV